MSSNTAAASPSSVEPRRPTRYLTGITTSGTPHLGNYVGSVRHSVRFSREADVESYFFLADYHALIKTTEPERVRQSTLEIAATWLACGLDPDRVTFYRQSDIPEIPELTWLLTCVAPKGMLNRAHAYKASVDRNEAAGADPDVDVSAGLFMYPVLMAADILMFNAHKVPVGRDQVQHIEMARDIGARFNHTYGAHFTLPEAEIDDAVATLPGLDGRKMSKSYGNTIALFAPRRELQKQIASIVTDSSAPGAPKSTEHSALFQIFKAFADSSETAAYRQAFADGIGWGDAKAHLFERIDREVAPLRKRYETLMADPAEIESVLIAGADKARAMASPFTARLRRSVGLRSLADGPSQPAPKSSRRPTKSGGFKQYRDGNGRFFFKLQSADGQTLLQSVAFTSPQEAGRVIAALQNEKPGALDAHAAFIEDGDGELAAMAREWLANAALERGNKAGGGV